MTHAIGDGRSTSLVIHQKEYETEYKRYGTEHQYN